MPNDPQINPSHVTCIAKARDLRSQAAHAFLGRAFRPVRRLLWEVSGWLSAVVGEIIGNAVAEWRRRRNIRRLSTLDDRLLKDIGIRREDIREALSAPPPSNDDATPVQAPRPNRRLISSAT